MSERDDRPASREPRQGPEQRPDAAGGSVEQDPRRLLPKTATGAVETVDSSPPSHPARRPHRAGLWIAGALALVLAYSAGMALHEQIQQRNRATREARLLTGGDPAEGATLARVHGCAGCHTIPGVPGANGLVGPSLGGVASRMYIAGVLINTPDNLVRWLQNPQAVDPLTAMPNVGLTESQARQIAAYLYTLRAQ